MTVLPWPPHQKPRQRKSGRKMIMDPLPAPVLHHLVSEIPGPPGETKTERADRFQRQLAEVMSYKPRSAAEAMIATHCVVLRLLETDSLRDAGRTDSPPNSRKKNQKFASQFDKQAREMEKLLAHWQTTPLGKRNPSLFEAVGIEPYLIPDPDDPEQAEAAVSAVIVPLHPAPKMLQ
jgi:hypothetical protein